MRLRYLAETYPAPHGTCHHCGTDGPLAFVAVYQRAVGGLDVRFCTRECWREWERQVGRLPDTGLTTGV